MKDQKVTDNIHLKILKNEMAEELFLLVDKNREHLKTFLPWLDKNTSIADTEFFIQDCNKILQNNGAPMFAIYQNNKIIGVAGFHALNKEHSFASIGYWLDKDKCGQGIMTQVARTLEILGFGQLQLNRIEIRCATQNIASNKVAQKLGYELEGTLKQAENLYGTFVDHNVYAKISN